MAEAVFVPALDAIRAAARPLTGAAGDFDPLMDLIGEARFVLLGEATHGTDEFYRARAAVTLRLVREKGFAAVAAEADWPDAHRVHRWITGRSADPYPEAALGDFVRFPRWMWRNTVFADLIRELRAHNLSRPATEPRVGFFGLDLYSLHASIRAVLDYLQRVDPDAAVVARERYSCFDHAGREGTEYGRSVGWGLSPSCEDEAVRQLAELRQGEWEYARRDGRIAEEDFFSAEQNARLVRNAEQYYRTMFRGRVSSWNLRDRHMAETLAELDAWLTERLRRPARIVVWAHNSHLGDARATEVSGHGELNVGQLVRQRHGSHAVLVGFSTYEGTVTAATDWDGPAERKTVRPALPGSVEELYHDTGTGDFLLDLRHAPDAVGDELRIDRLTRMIGVVYRPETERQSHYFFARPAEQFDAVIHYERTTALEPLDPDAAPTRGEEETYPTGM
mgnify:CR=1 FL=1